MRMLRLVIVGIALVTHPVTVRAATPASTTATTSGPAGRLVAVLVPEDGMADLAIGLIGYRAEHDPATGAETRAMQARYPGLGDHVAERLEPQLLKILKRELPALRRQVGAIIGGAMTAREIADSEVFFTSPAGRKVYANALHALAERPDRSETETAQAVMTAAFSNIALKDYPAVLAFTASSAAGKINALNPQIARVSRAWADRLIEKNGARIDKLSKRATREFVKKAERKRKV